MNTKRVAKKPDNFWSNLSPSLSGFLIFDNIFLIIRLRFFSNGPKFHIYDLRY